MTALEPIIDTTLRRYDAHTARGRVADVVAESGPLVTADAVSVELDGTRLLGDVTMAIHPGELVAIIGASGAGKTTLLDVLAGLRAPTSGRVIAHGGPVELGYVPQDDIVHRELTVESTVAYAARLRLPSPTSNDVRASVERTLALLGLSNRSRQTVGSLSGGQRKRVSIATELVVHPHICFLDEPTAGLDPRAAADLVQLLRSLADAGTAIVMTTHNLADLELADRLVVVADGGLAYDGTPEGGTQHLGPGAPRREQSGAAPARSLQRREPATATHARTASRHERTRRSCVEQLRVLTRRNVELMLRNRMSLAIMAGSPLLIVAMFAVLFRPGAFNPTATDGSAPIAITYWLAFAGFFFGLTFGLLQIVTERAILRRERLVTVDVAPYLLAKVAVLVPFLGLVNLVMVATLGWLDRLPSLTTAHASALWSLLLLDSLAGLTLGLTASAAVTSPAQAALALPMLCFPAVLFSGAVLPLASMTPAGRGIAAVMSDRWAFEALARTLTLGNAPAGSPRRYAVDLHAGALSGPIQVHAVVLVALAIGFLAIAHFVIARRTR